MRYIHEIWIPTVGITIDNELLKEHYLGKLDGLAGVEPEQLDALREAVSYFLMGGRSRQTVPEWNELESFASRAGAFERAVDDAVDQLAKQVLEATGGEVEFDAIFTTTSTGSLMPSVSYRLAAKLGKAVRSDSMMIDLAHVGCTGGIKLLNLVRNLGDEVKNCLVVTLEFPTTLINQASPNVDVWQGNCTFGDGGSAIWVSTDPEQGGRALALGDIQFRQHAANGLNLIQWGYSDYYNFRLADEQTFNQDVREYVTQSLAEVNKDCLESPRWAIHPAGLALLMRISRKIGLNKKALKGSADHYRQFSNMSSAGIMHVIRDVMQTTEVGMEINLLTMGAGFNVLYGRLDRVR